MIYVLASVIVDRALVKSRIKGVRTDSHIGSNFNTVLHDTISCDIVNLTVDDHINEEIDA